MGTTGQPVNMPTDGHTRQRTTALTLTTIFAREICRACADRALRKRPPDACHRHHLDTIHRSSDSTSTKQPRKSTLDTPDRPATKARAATQTHLDAIIVAKQTSTHLTSTNQPPPTIGLLVAVCFKTMPPRRRKARGRLHRPIQKI
jgi:hypothetical protein